MGISVRSRHGIKTVLMIVAAVLNTVLCVGYLAGAPFFDALDRRTTDSMIALTPPGPASGSVVIVDIDEKSLARYGQWPWSRSLLARLLDSIAAAGAASIGLDMILAEPERSSSWPGAAAPNPHDPAPGEPAAKLPGPDHLLANTLARGPYVLGYAFSFRNAAKPPPKCNLHPPALVLVGMKEGLDAFTTANGVTCNLPSFSDAVSRSGFLNATTDADGILRRIPMLVRFGNDLYPSLTLAMLMQYRDKEQLEIVRRETSGRTDIMWERPISLDDRGYLVLRFSQSSKATPRVSASTVLNGGQEASLLYKMIVLVGFSAAGLEPTYQTAMGLRLPVEIHAQAMENLLSGELVVRTAYFYIWEAMVGMVIAAGAAMAVACLRPVYSAIICAALMAGTWIGLYLVFRESNYLFSPLLPTVLVPANFAVLSTVKGWLELAEKQRQLQEINQSLEKRVADTVSELRRKDQMLIQQGRQAAMGEMLNNIAHQWRQPLNMLALIVQELRMTYGTDHFNEKNLEASVANAMKQIQHMSQTIDDFRNFFKPEKAKTPFRVRDSIAMALALAEANLKSSRIDVEVTMREDPEIFGYPNEYAQVLLNLLMNCRDAFEANDAVERRKIEIVADKAGENSVVTITDNAGGIPKEIFDKIFDPYFTTKGPDKGTGIGLYMAKSIIENNMKGKLTARNTGSGAEFTIEV